MRSGPVTRGARLMPQWSHAGCQRTPTPGPAGPVPPDTAGCFANAFADLVEGACLGVTSGYLGDRAYVKAFRITLNHDIELVWHSFRPRLPLQTGSAAFESCSAARRWKFPAGEDFSGVMRPGIPNSASPTT